jgi:hypothetical protein
MVPGGRTELFVTDELMIVPTPGAPSSSDVVLMQYKVLEFDGAQPPPQHWQDAYRRVWKGEEKWCFKLTCGKMKVTVRCIDRSGHETTASDPSPELEFGVAGE